MKILFAAPFDGVPGGILRWAQHIYAYYKELTPKDISLIPFSLGRSRFINTNQSFIYRLYYGIIDYTKILINYKKKLKIERFDIIHISSSASISLIKDLYMIYLAHKYGAKAIIHFHFGRIPELKEKNNWEWKLFKKTIKRADRIITMDCKSYNALSNYGNIELVPNPIAPEILKLIDKCPIKKRNSRTILFVGHVVKTKGIYELVSACKEISDINLKLIGYVTSETKKSLEALAGKSHSSWLEIAGELPYDEVIFQMQKCDIFILPTYTEGFPNVILESMACGCAIIATSVGAIPEMLNKNGLNSCGILIEPKNINQIRDAISLLLNNDQLKNELRNNAWKRVRNYYSINIIWDKLTSIWSNLQ